MEFKKVDYIPGRILVNGYAKCKRQADLERFVSSNIEIAKVSGWEEEYKNITTAAECIRACAKRYKLPVTASQRKNELYIIRTDM